MATEGKETGVPAAKPAEPAMHAESHPVVTVKVAKKKKKKRKYTRGMRTIQDFQRGTTRAAREISKAVSKGMSVYRRRENRSSRKKRDGALRDVVENVGKALGRGLRSGSDAPYEFAKAINSRRFSKQVRDAVRIVVPPIFR